MYESAVLVWSPIDALYARVEVARKQVRKRPVSRTCPVFSSCVVALLFTELSYALDYRAVLCTSFMELVKCLCCVG